MNRAAAHSGGWLVAMVICAALAPAAAAQRAYVGNFASDSVTLFDTATNAPQGSIPVGGGPAEVAITPDGSRMYVANSEDDTVSAIDTAASAVVATIAVGDEPQAVAIAPDGSRVYVANAKGNSVSVIATTTNSVSGPPIPVGGTPEGIAITPDGARAFVAQVGGGISVIETATAVVVGSIPDSLGPAKLAISPDGSRGFVTNKSSNSLTIFSLGTGTVLGSPVLTGANPAGIALAPNGPAYVSSGSDNTVVMVDPASHSKVGPPIPGLAGPAGIATSADGATAYVANSAGSSVSVIDAATSSLRGTIPTGASPRALAIVPDQPPHAAFSAERAEKQGQLIGFDASATSDVDGRVGSYDWDFGDGQTESGPSPRIEHAYATPGAYRVTLTATDEQGCSTTFVFSGQTASCNGSAVARTTGQVRALDTTKPIFRFAAAHRQFLGSRVTLKARCPKEACSVSVSGVLDRHIHTAKARVSIPAGGKATLRLRLTKKVVAAARRSLAKHGTATLQVKAFATDVADNKTTRKLELRLLVPQKRKAAA